MIQMWFKQQYVFGIRSLHLKLTIMLTRWSKKKNIFFANQAYLTHGQET